ncbi:MAG: BPSS1780 family membrane protein [Alphaproteobacteria bacterium]|nr:BPSS1780 family membrane protein [Alphaproteobacteria bacterium]
MKLQLVPARQGMQWMRQGLRVFWRQPIALTGLFFMFMGLMTTVSLLPIVGTWVALLMFPACTLGLMAATREAVQGHFPMPRMLLVALLGAAERRRQMLVLGALYALGFAVVLMLSAISDGGEFARLYLNAQLGGKLDVETLDQPGFQSAAMFSLVFYLPLSALFWHAPALVHWHGVPAVKSLFFSIMACLGNWKAMLVYMACWMGLYGAVGMALMVMAALLDSVALISWTFMPLMLMLTAMFFCTSYFTFQDSFQNEVLA